MHARIRYPTLAQQAVLPLALAALVLLAITLVLPIVSIVVGGKAHVLTVSGAIEALANRNSLALALLVAFTVCIAPTVELALRGMSGLASARKHRRAGLAPLLVVVQPWSMLGVFALGVVIATRKIGEQTAVAPALGLASLLLLLACAWGAAWIGPTAATASASPPHSRLLGWSYVLSAALLLIPAFLLPIAVTHSGHGVQGTTIFGGVRLLWDLHSHALAVVLFLASIVVPTAKLVTLALVLRLRSHKSRAVAARLSRAWHVIHRLGPWSMLDIFALGTLVTLLRAPPLISTQTTVGAVAFASVIVLTLVATEIIAPPRGAQL